MILSAAILAGVHTIAFVDSDPMVIATFHEITGTTWKVVEPKQAEQIVISSRQFVMLSPDEIVPRTKRRINQLRRESPKAHFSLFLAETGDSITRSLTKQAAREGGADVIDPGESLGVNPAERGALALYEKLVAGREDQKGWRLIGFSSQEPEEGTAAMAIDGNPDTYWHSQYSPITPKPPHMLTVELPEARMIGGFAYLPRQDGGDNGTASKVDFSWSLDGKTWSKPVEFDCKKPSGRTSFILDAPVKVKQFRFRILAAQNGAPYGSAAEIDILPPLLAHSHGR